MPPFWSEPGRALGMWEDAPRAGSYRRTYNRTRSCRQFFLGGHDFSRALSGLESLRLIFGFEGGDGFDQARDREGVPDAALAYHEV